MGQIRYGTHFIQLEGPFNEPLTSDAEFAILSKATRMSSDFFWASVKCSEWTSYCDERSSVSSNSLPRPYNR